MANEYMTIEELKKLAEKKHIYIPSGYKKLDMIEYINEEIARMKGDKKKEKSISKSNTKSPARIHYAPITHQVYAPVNNIVNNYYTVPEIKEIAKVNKIETPSGIRKEELIELVNEILSKRLKNKTPIKIPKELSIKVKSKVVSPKPKSRTVSPKPKSPIKQPQQQKPQQPQQQKPQQQKPQQQKPQQQKPQQPQQPKPKSRTVSPKPKSRTVSPKPKSRTVSPKSKVKEELPELLPIPRFIPEQETPEQETPEQETPEQETENFSLPTLPSSPMKSKSIKTKFLPRVFNYDEEE